SRRRSRSTSSPADRSARRPPAAVWPPSRMGDNAQMPSTDIPILELEDFAIELAHTAGGIARAHFRKSFTIENKGADHFDPVTNADKAIEQVLRAAIGERYPEHGIVGEEQEERGGSAPYRWYIDPIDGTRAFMTGSPLWGTLVGLTRGDVPLFGLMCQPVLEEEERHVAAREPK